MIKPIVDNNILYGRNTSRLVKFSCIPPPPPVQFLQNNDLFCYRAGEIRNQHEKMKTKYTY